MKKVRAVVLLFCLLTVAAASINAAEPAPYGRTRKVSAGRRPQCSDRRDNDHDKRVDYPRDRGCKSRRDNSERGPRVPKPSPTATAVPTPGDLAPMELGIGVSLQGRPVFPSDNPWNQDISDRPVHTNSDRLIASIGLTAALHPDFGTFWQGSPIGIPYIVVAADQPRVPVSFYYPDESDPGPYPIPANAPIEGGSDSSGDRHVLVIDRDNWVLYETYDSHPGAGGSWSCGSGAVFDLRSNALRPAGWTSADAAGLPIFPGLVRYDEVFERGEINHALRFTAPRTRRAYVYPARHYASSSDSPDLPPMGMRVRLKASVDISRFPSDVQVILRALKRYGMILADNGSPWFITGAHDPRWDDESLHAISRLTGRDFEVVQDQKAPG